MTIKTVAVVGASGNIGAPITKALLAAGFKVTAITRESSSSTFPENVDVRKADLTSVGSVAKALSGQDAVVITIASAAVGEQNPIIDGALAAGVKRVIPSEFGHNPAKIKHPVLPKLLIGKTKALEHLRELSKANPWFTWTGIGTEPFFDWGLDHGVIGIDLQNKTIKLFDSGNQTVATTRLPFIADAVVSVLQREEQTANKYISVAEFIITQNEVHKIFEEVTGAKFKVINVNTSDLEKAGHEALAKGDYGGSFVPFLLAYNWADSQGHGYTVADADNALLGLKGVNEVDVKDAIAEWVKSKSA